MLANETVGATELLDELRAIDDEGKAEYFVCVPANPVDTGQAEHTGAVWVWEETVKAAQARLDSTLEILRADGLHAEGELGDHRPLQALADAVAEVQAGPDRHLHPPGGAFGVAAAGRRRQGAHHVPGHPGPAHRVDGGRRRGGDVLILPVRGLSTGAALRMSRDVGQ